MLGHCFELKVTGGIGLNIKFLGLYATKYYSPYYYSDPPEGYAAAPFQALGTCELYALLRVPGPVLVIYL